MKATPKPLFWVASSLRDLRRFPGEVQDIAGFALYLAQVGEKHALAKPLKGFGGAGVLEVIADHDGEAYRAVYTIRFKDVIYVLHAFQKKSRKGIATPKNELEVVRARLRQAADHYAEWSKSDES